jgi:predicted enzyme related to lactoylglutathione lyase
MLRVYVSDVARSEQFYHQVIGASVIQKMGDKVRIMTFPGGTMPGIILIQSPEVATMHSSFVLQVPDLKATLASAEANGGTLKNTHFEQQQAGMPAQSSHFSDPDGNLIEVLQMGARNK